MELKLEILISLIYKWFCYGKSSDSNQQNLYLSELESPMPLDVFFHFEFGCKVIDYFPYLQSNCLFLENETFSRLFIKQKRMTVWPSSCCYRFVAYCRAKGPLMLALTTNGTGIGICGSVKVPVALMFPLTLRVFPSRSPFMMKVQLICCPS